MGWIGEKGPLNDVVLSSRIRLARNIKDVRFPIYLGPDEAENLVNMIRNGVINKSSDQFDFYKLKDLTLVEKELLVEKHLISRDLIANSAISAVLINKDEQISIMLNEEDHIRMQCIMPGYQLDKAAETINQIDDQIEISVEYSFDENIGYLTCCPTNVGTGMRASVMLHLPALVMSKYINAILQTISKIGLTARGLYGEGSEALGSIFQISNQVTLGPSEEEIINNLNIAVNQIIQKERIARKNLYKSSPIDFEDKIWRAFGTLANARKINIREFMVLVSQVRLGVHMGIISNIKPEFMDMLIIEGQPANIQKRVEHELTSGEMEVVRAEMIRDRLTSFI